MGLRTALSNFASGFGSFVGGAAKNVAGALTGQAAVSKQISMTNEANRAAAEAAWRRETSYNHPVAQMDRLKQAGLNPAMIYGTGVAGASGNTHASVPNVQAYDLTGGLSKQLTLQSIALNNDLMRRQGKLLDSQAANVDAQTSDIMHELHLRGYKEPLPTSKSDPWFMRYGGRVGRQLMSDYFMNKSLPRGKSVWDVFSK